MSNVDQVSAVGIKMKKSLRIVQWNCRSIRNKLLELEWLVKKLNPQVVLINESWAQPHENYDYKHLGFAVFRNDRSNESPNNFYHGGVMILVHHSIKVTGKFFDFNTESSEWLGIQIKIGDVAVNVCTGYRSPDEDLEMDFLMETLESQTPTIFAGDLNGWHPRLKSGPETNSTGLELVDLINALSLIN